MPTRTVLGSVSTGTLRTQDLLPAFSEALEDLLPTDPQEDRSAARILGEAGVLLAIPSDDWTDDQEGQAWDLVEDLREQLEQHAAPYTYFGSHPGDGADYGYWIDWDSINEDLHDGTLVRHEDRPDGFDGCSIDVNDHGNTTLYGSDGSECWAVV